jgi:FKBP-type peptidyl-prolyl cis-trans isomerase 2
MPRGRLQGKNSPTANAKYRSRSALLHERTSKLVSGSGELTTGVEPAMIGREAGHLIHVTVAREHLRKPQNDTQIIRGG